MLFHDTLKIRSPTKGCSCTKGGRTEEADRRVCHTARRFRNTEKERGEGLTSHHTCCTSSSHQRSSTRSPAPLRTHRTDPSWALTLLLCLFPVSFPAVGSRNSPSVLTLGSESLGRYIGAERELCPEHKLPGHQRICLHNFVS